MKGVRSKKSGQDMLDMLRPTDPLRGTEFEVKSYDYLALQQDNAFEADLQCLMGMGKITPSIKPNNESNDSNELPKKRNSPKKPTRLNKLNKSPQKDLSNGRRKPNNEKPRLIKINSDKITQDIDDIVLSSDEYVSDISIESPIANIRRNKGKSSSTSSTPKPLAKTHKPEEVDNDSNVVQQQEQQQEQQTPSTPKRKAKKKRIKKKVLEDSEFSNAAITGGMKEVSNGIEYIDDGKPVKTTGDQVFLQGEKDNEIITVEQLKEKKIVAQNYNVLDGEANLSRSQRRRKLMKEKKARRKEEEEEKEEKAKEKEKEQSEHQDISTDVSPPSSMATPRKNQMDDVPRFSASPPQTSPELESPFSIKLRPTSRPMTNAKYSSKLQPIDPIKTIIGISHTQILKMSLTDVKCKTITTSTHISKLMKSALEFAFDNTDGLFEDEQLKSKFVQLCVHIALFESPGFKKVNNEFSVNELFGKYEQLSLETTGTKLTPPMEAIHQNNFDYTLLSYIGNIIIWVYSLQIQDGVVEDLVHNYPELGLEKSAIIKAFGGNHLWDQLNRNTGAVNNKRWKHIVKYRENFGFFEDQFMLLMRFMNMPCHL